MTPAHDHIEKETKHPAMPLDRNGANFFIYLLPTLAMMLFTPHKAFRPDEEIPPGQAAGFFIFMTTAGAFLSTLIYNLNKPDHVIGLKEIFFFIGMGLLVAALAGFIAFALYAPIVHGCLGFLQGMHTRFHQTMRVVAYSVGSIMATAAASDAPYFQVWAGIWLSIMLLCGFKSAHGIAWWKVAVVALTPGALVLGMWVATQFIEG